MPRTASRRTRSFGSRSISRSVRIAPSPPIRPSAIAIAWRASTAGSLAWAPSAATDALSASAAKAWAAFARTWGSGSSSAVSKGPRLSGRPMAPSASAADARTPGSGSATATARTLRPRGSRRMPSAIAAVCRIPGIGSLSALNSGPRSRT
jgi:hypothetical protein